MATVEDGIEDNLEALQAYLQEDSLYFKKAFKNLDNQEDKQLLEMIRPGYREGISKAIRHDTFKQMNGIFTDPRALHYNPITEGGDQIALVQMARQGYNNRQHMYDISPLQRLGISEAIANLNIPS